MWYNFLGYFMNKIDDKKSITLQQFLKKNNIVSSGGEAKYLIQEGEVKINKNIVTQRSKKLQINDVVEVNGKEYVVQE